jgi:3-hydroxyisobutyrate dehydrogenase
MRVGFVGLGDQGEPMARRILAAGYPLAVFARRPVQAETLIASGAVDAGSLATLAGRSDLLSVCVGTDFQVREVCDVALQHLSPGSVLAIHSTVSPQTCLEIGEAGHRRGVAVLDAPVSGGRLRAIDGQLTVMVGGEESAVERVRPVFGTFGALVLHVGALGSGEVLKLVNNYLFTAQIGIADQAVQLLTTLGLDVVGSMTAIASSTGSSRCIQMFVEGDRAHVFPRHSGGRGYGGQLLAKDIELVNTVMAQHGHVFPELLERTAQVGLRAALDSSALD